MKMKMKKMKGKMAKPMQDASEGAKGYGNAKKHKMAADSSKGRFNQPKGEKNKKDKMATKNVRNMKF